MATLVKVNRIAVREASRVYGDLTEKEFLEKAAFTVDVNPLNIAASAVGGYAATRYYDKGQDKKRAGELAKQTLENDHYANVQNLLRNMKIVFTPINVIYSVDNQVFEIIKADEMSPEMRKAFLNKDGEYYKTLLLKKINMELQLAEQFFARNLIQPQLPEQYKTAFTSMKWFEKISFDHVLDSLDAMEKIASAQSIESYKLELNLNAIRPFESHSAIEMFDKVANYFKADIHETLSRKDLESSVKIGFLPDRVIFTLNGQLLEQLPIMHMNDEGYNAFKKRDKEFFFNFFIDESRKIEASILEQMTNDVMNDMNKQASENEETESADDDSWAEELAEVLRKDRSDEELDEDEEERLREEIGDVAIEKEAATLEDVRSSWDEVLSIERPDLDIWKSPDVHPLAYDWLFDNFYGPTWHEKDLTALMQQVTQDFGIEQINSIAYDKISMLSVVQNDNNSVYLTDFPFEKFLRVMNSLTTDMEEYEGGIEFEQFLFAMDIITTLGEENEVFYGFGDDIGNYVAKILKADGIRFISDQVYDETNEGEAAFYDEVNSYLERLWKEEDTIGLLGKEAETVRKKTERINQTTQDILTGYAEDIDPVRPYDSIAEILEAKPMFMTLSSEERYAVSRQAGRHVIASMFLKIKSEEFIKTIELLKGVVEDEQQ